MSLLRRQASSGRRRLRIDEDLQAKAPKFSYRNRRSEAERDTGRQLQREATQAARLNTSRFWLQRFGLIILLLAVLASAVNLVTLSPMANVQPITVTQPNSLIGSQASYTAAANKLLGSSIWNRTKLTINTSQISQQLLKQFPQLAHASVTISLLSHRPIIHIQSAQPVLILVNGNGSFLLDGAGRVLQMASSTADLHQAVLPVVTDQSGLRPQLNQQALPVTDVDFIQTVVAQLEAKHYNPAGLTLPAAASELDVQLSGQPYLIKFNLQSNTARQQAGTFLATIAQLQQQGITPAHYVDVRVDGRAYYQ